MRSPSSSAGTPASSTSSTRFRSHPASNHAQAATAAAATASEHEEPGQTESFSVTGCDRDDVALELQLGAVEPGRDADELREVQDRHLEVLARLLAQLRLPRVEREVAERARRDHRVGAGLLRLLDRLDELGERDVLTRLDDREAAALDLRRVVDRLAAARAR